MADVSPAAAHKRRWYQFSLRTLLVAVTLLAIPCWYVGTEIQRVRQRAELLHWFEDHRTVAYDYMIVFDDSKLPWYRRLLGDHYWNWAHDYAFESHEEWMRTKELFPELELNPPLPSFRTFGAVKVQSIPPQ